MNSSLRPVFTFVSDLTAAKLGNKFDLQWIFPTDYTNLSVNDASQVLDYKLYRHIEITYPSYNANGGSLIDPNTYIPIVNAPLNEPKFKLIATLSPTVTSYTDNLTDLNVHNDEGIIFDTIIQRWVDGNGTDILNDIFNTNRRIYYKIVADYKKIPFNKTPFIFLCHTNGVECRSTITQVKWNTLYYEGDTVWFNNAITNCNRTSVDLKIDANTDRTYNVWVSGPTNKVYCLDGRDGTLKKTYTLPITNILGIRVDPDNGDGIVTGSSNTVYRCILSDGSYASIINTGTTYAPNGNTGLVLVKEDNNHFAYIIANQDVVSRCGIDTSINSIVPRTTFGCSDSTNSNIPNVLGITNSTDGGIWVNGHTPIHYQYYYSYTSYSTNCDWIGVCPGGSPTSDIIHYYNSRGNSGIPSCNAAKHYTCQTVANTVTVNVDTNFLQDVGYVYGAKTGINNGITNGKSYPYSSGTYKPFTSNTNRSGWFGISPLGSDNFGRPYTTGSSLDPQTSPNPGLSQKGLASDIPLSGDLTGNTYNIFQTNEIENRVHKLTWNGTLSTLDYNYIASSLSVGDINKDYWSITNPVHICVDSQNNIWVIQENTSNELTMIYQLLSSSNFPYGGDSTWPILPNIANTFGRTSAYSYGDYFSDPYIEFYLTRNTNFVGLTATPSDGYRNGFGVRLVGSNAQQKETARTWCLSSTNFLTPGKRLYPNFTGQYTTKSFTRYGGDTTEYNSDNLGMLYAMGEHSVELWDITHPSPAYPQVRLNITKGNSTPSNCDGDFWNDQNINDTTHLNASGYDDFTVQLSATILSMGSFTFQAYNFYFDDKLVDLGGSINPLSSTTINNVINYDFHDPSINGKPNNRWVGYPAENNGVYNPYVTIETNPDCYYLSGSQIMVGTSNTVGAIVWERWPTARFYVTPFDTSLIRQAYLTTWNLSSYSYPVGNNGQTNNSESRIVSGYDPLSAQFTDTSISRTWPISAWFWDFGDKPDYLGFALDNSVIGVSYPHITSQIITNSTPASLRDDCITEHTNMTQHVYKGPGKYFATLYVRASNTFTDSWQVSAGITDQNFMISSFTIAASREIDVLEICPNLEFTITSAFTYTSGYSDDYAGSVIPVSAKTRWDGVFSYNGLVSGYAPYLGIQLIGSATARSLPFSALRWDFSDPFADIESYDSTKYPYPTAGWPYWNNTPYQLSGRHEFVMPGFYDITLIPVVSGYTPNYISNCTGLRKHMQVYVEELLPIPNFVNSYNQTTAYTISSLSGISPTTIYVNPSSTIAKSFPVCRIDWDFGDNTSITTISKLMSSQYVNYYNSSAYTDPSDPRNIIISHEYSKTQYAQASSYTISMSAFACNTNSVMIATKEFGPIETAKISDIEGELRLIDSRMSNNDNDLLLVFEGQKSLNNFTVLISSNNL